MNHTEQLLLRIPGVTEAQVFTKVFVRCEFPMSDETMMELQCAQARIEYETGWKVEMTISAGKGRGALAESEKDVAWEKARTRVADLHERNLQGWQR